MNWIEKSFGEVQWRRHIVGDTGGRIELGATFSRFPNTEELDEEVVAEAGVQHLANQEDIGAKRGLQHDGHVGGIEEAYRVAAAHASLARGFDRDLNAETLEVDDLWQISLRNCDENTL